MESFKDLGLSAALLENLSSAGFLNPTPIQAKAIPLLMEGHDLLGIAQTGTGKTGAFSLPIIQKLSGPGSEDKKKARALIVSPTRELCQQITEAVRVFTNNLHLETVTIVGGADQAEQVSALRSGVDIIVATPGRLLDLYRQKQLPLSGIEMFVLDEADRMLDMGFMEDLGELLEILPKRRQSMLFSATMPSEVSRFAFRLLNNPRRVEVNPAGSTVEKIQQRVIHVKRDHKFQLLKKILKDEEVELALVFTRTKEQADSVVAYLAQNRVASRALHGDKKQSERERALDHFKDRVIRVLVATDIASRGIDIEGVSHVINFDLPLEVESYVHRIGRTGRAGRAGIAVTFCEAAEKNHLKKIEELIGFSLPSESFEGKFEPLRLKKAVAKKVTKPTPGKSQERTAYLDHSKRQPQLEEGEKKRVHPGFKKTKKKRK